MVRLFIELFFVSFLPSVHFCNVFFFAGLLPSAFLTGRFVYILLSILRDVKK
jgi:hypothetical protein